MAWKEINSQSLNWTDIVQPTPDEIESLRERFGLLPTHVQDIRINGQRPKSEASQAYLFLILHFPVYNRATREIVPSEVDFVVTRDAVVTVHDGSLQSLNELATLTNTNEAAQRRASEGGPLGLVYVCLDRLLAACNPMLDHISQDLQSIEKKIFNGAEREMVREILISRRNVTDFRRIMQSHKNTLKKFVDVASDRRLFSGPAQTTSFYRLIDQTKEIWEHLESFKETVEALQATNESLISHHLNVIMKNYTSFSVLIFAMTLLAALFAIDIHGAPLLHLRFGFWYIVSAETILAGSLYFIFKHKRWI